MHKRILALVILAVAATSPAQATTYYRGNVFLEMMLAMMDVMGIIDYERDYNDTYPNFRNFSYGMSPYGFNPWSSPVSSMAWQQAFNNVAPGWAGDALPSPGSFESWSPSPQAVIPYLPEYFDQYRTGSRAYKPHWIEGRWIANDNMIMEVSNGRFVMYYRDNPRQVRGGMIRLKDKWLAIAETTRKIIRQYEFAYKKDKLVLKDSDGNLMLFRRLPNWPLPVK